MKEDETLPAMIELVLREPEPTTTTTSAPHQQGTDFTPSSPEAATCDESEATCDEPEAPTCDEPEAPTCDEPEAPTCDEPDVASLLGEAEPFSELAQHGYSVDEMLIDEACDPDLLELEAEFFISPETTP